MNQDNLWYKDALFYELYVRAFADGNGDGHGDLRGLVARLDYLQELGVDCIWLLPSYPSPLRDDGYDIADFTAIHPDYGTLDDFKAVLDAAHRRGMRVITDLVMNHTSDQHPWFQAARVSRGSPQRDYYVWSDTDQRYRDTRIIFLDTEPSNWTWDELAGQYYWHRFFAHQPDLNYDNPQVQQEMLEVVRFWMELGVDGFRADAVPYLFEREETNCENLPETHVYLKRVRRYLDEHYPGRILLAEANQLPQDLVAYFGDGDEFHMGFHFAVMPRLYMALKQADRSPILDILKRTPAIPAACQWTIFLRNHDELTLEMVTPEEREFMWRAYAPEPRMRLNLGIRRRLAPLLDNDRRRIELLYSLLFTLPGSPILYYGDEIGMGDNIALPDRNGVRTPMQWSVEANAGFSAASPARLYAPVIAQGDYAYTRVNVQAQSADPGSLLNQVKHMIQVRKGHAYIGRGTFEWLLSAQGEVAPSNPAVLIYLRRYQAETILALHNLSDASQLVALDLGAWAGHIPQDLLAGRKLPPIRDTAYTLELEPFGYLWLGI
jgi:maltose alpha-D-glucosyltransferase/alpha-amylase